jgi:hypothetical protein
MIHLAFGHISIALTLGWHDLAVGGAFPVLAVCEMRRRHWISSMGRESNSSVGSDVGML